MAYTLSHFTPTPTAIQWANVHIVYDGVDYAVADGSTTDKYVYWLLSAPAVLQTSATFPALTADDAMVFINNAGVGLSVLEASVVEGSLVVPGTIQAGALAANSVSAENIQAEAITANKIAAGAITANHIAAGTITADKLAANNLSAISADLGDITAGRITMNNQGYIRGGQTAYNTGAGFFLGYSGAAYKFSIGDANKALTWDGATLTLTGDLVATGNIIANAVTNSVSAYTSGSINITATSNPVTVVQSVSIITTGGPVFLSFAAQTVGGNSGAGGGTGWFTWTIVRGTTVLAQGDTFHEYQTSTGVGFDHSFAFSITDSPAPGAYTYYLKIGATGSGQVPTTPSAKRRALTAIEMKR